jgi:hypothetical protein
MQEEQKEKETWFWLLRLSSDCRLLTAPPWRILGCFFLRQDYVNQGKNTFRAWFLCFSITQIFQS